MRAALHVVVLAAAAVAAAELPEGLRTGGHVPVAPGTYRLTRPIRVVESGTVLDLTDVILEGPHAGGPPDAFSDTAIVIDGVDSVVVAHATIRGFKIGIAARACAALVIRDCDVSGNYRQRLHSTPERENEADWLWPHHNDANEWAAYGAGIYLDQCRGAEVAGNVGHGGQNGIILSRTDLSFVYDNDMSFNSGWGLAMWRSCANEISHNRFDYCVRGYSHDVYRRGQDSAGILVFEQCTDNVFAFNSATHGGDGFFLYAGHETVERTGIGGSNRNLLHGNDFSHAVANGIEATFSEGNRFVKNLLDECEYGIWAGYSYGGEIVGNVISRCARAGIAIEHGHDTRIEGNRFESNGVGVLLWAFPNAQFDSSVYGAHQNTHSEHYLIAKNLFEGDSTSIRLHASRQVRIVYNECAPKGSALTVRTSCPGLAFWRNHVRGGNLLVKNEGADAVYSLANVAVVDSVEGEVVVADSLPDALPPRIARARDTRRPAVRGTMAPFLPHDVRRGRQTILVDDWGPVRPGTHVFPLQASGWGDVTIFAAATEEAFQTFDVRFVAGPVYVEPLAGRLPARIRVTPARSGFVVATLQVACGDSIHDVRVFIASSPWFVRFFGWEPSAPGEPPGDFAAVTAAEPLDTLITDRIDFWWGGAAPTVRVPAEHFATVAETTVDLPAGTYVMHAISDDGIRVFVDGAPVIDEWSAHFSREDRGTFSITTGRHVVRLEHCQIDGSSWLQAWITQ